MAGFARTVLIDRPVEEVFEAERPGRGPAGLHRIVQHDRIGGRCRGGVYYLQGAAQVIRRGCVSVCVCVLLVGRSASHPNPHSIRINKSPASI